MIITREFLMRVLPAPDMKSQVIKKSQTVNNIVDEVVRAHKIFSSDYEKIAEFFRGADVRDTASNVFNFLRNNIAYVVEEEDNQTTRSPGRFLKDAKGDCKHFALFISGIVDNLGYNWFYRFAGYSANESLLSHVFVVILDERNNEIWIDPVLRRLNSRYPAPVIVDDVYINKKKMLSRLSGIGLTELPNDGPLNISAPENEPPLNNQILSTLPIQSQLPGAQIPASDPLIIQKSSKYKWLLWAAAIFIISKMLKK